MKKEKILPVYVSKKNSNRENQFNLLMISNGEGCEVQRTTEMALSCS